MLIRIGFEIEINSAIPVPMLLALSTHSELGDSLFGEDVVRFEPEISSREYMDRFGNRITRIVAPTGSLRLWSNNVIKVNGDGDLQQLTAPQHPVPDLPDEALTFLIPSRYCDSDNLTEDAWSLFGSTLGGWARVQAITQFVHDHVTFGYQFGRANKTASEVFREKSGVCRDFAHLAISLCRAMNIPARYVSGYLGDIGVPYSGPGDFCAWFEVFLGGRWYTFDARYNVPRIGRVVMVKGTDAADVAMITSFGGYQLKYFRVWTDEISDELDENSIRDSLLHRPAGDPLVYPSSARAA